MFVVKRKAKNMQLLRDRQEQEKYLNIKTTNLQI